MHGRAGSVLVGRARAVLDWLACLGKQGRVGVTIVPAVKIFISLRYWYSVVKSSK